jgi:broad specificity phosphatase PhoE
MSDINMDPSRELVMLWVRHGELNIQNRWDGWGNFVLSPEGRQSAEKAGQWLAYQKVGRIISSDLPRAYQTAEIIMNEVNAACPFLATDPNLRAWFLGDEFTGKEKTPERKARLQYFRANPDVPIPGGESWNQGVDRVKVIFQYACSPYESLPTVAVIHNSVIKMAMGLDEKGDIVEPGGIIGVYLDPQGEFEFEVLMGATKMDSNVIADASCG